MARSATRAARRKQEREERRRSRRALRPAGQTLAHNGGVYLIPARLDPRACAIHEAGHCLVAHAVGMHVIYATVKREIVLPGRICRKGHPGEHVNTTDTPFVSDGFNVAEPLLAADVSQQLQAGLPLTVEHRLWLAQSALSSAAGPLAEIGAGLGDGGALRAYPAWRDLRVDGEAFFVIDEGGDDGSCGQGRWLADPGLAVGADGAVAAGAAAAPVGLSPAAGAEP